MANRIRAFDWTSTPLGPIDAWPPSLRTIIDLTLSNGFPMVVLWGADLLQIYNDGYRDLMERTRPEGLGQPVRESWPEVWHRNAPIYERVWAGETITLDEAICPITRSGTSEDAWFSLSYSPLRSDTGVITGVLVTAFEMTARVRSGAVTRASWAPWPSDGTANGVTGLKDAAAAQRQGDGQYHLLFQMLDQGFCVVEVLFDERGRGVDFLFLETNSTFGRITGLGDVIGQRMRILTPEHEQYWFEIYGRVALTGVAERFEAEAAALGHWYNAFAYRIGDAGEHRVAILFEEITARKRAEEALREGEERYRRIVEQAVDHAIFTTDARGCIDTWPGGAEHVFGWSASEVIGKSIALTYTPEDRAARVPEQEMAIARAEGKAPNVRWHQRKDGTRVFIEGMAYPRWGRDGVFQGVFKIGQDITARLLAEERHREAEAALREEEERMREELAEQVAAATSELRTLSRRLLTVQEEERRNLARELHDEIGQMLTGLNFQLAGITDANGSALHDAQATVEVLTEQVRQLSMNLRPGVLDAFGLLAALEWHIERFQQQTGIRIHLRHEQVPERFAPEVEIAVFRVFQEALTNIARHANTDFATVQLIVDDCLLTLVIRDTGRGFDARRPVLSTGLGGMRERVELLDGRLEIESTPDHGTTLIAEVPLRKWDDKRRE